MMSSTRGSPASHGADVERHRSGQPACGPGGQFFIAIYNDEGGMSRFWKAVKRIYCSGTVGRWLILAVFVPYFALRHIVKWIVTGGRTSSKRTRGMSVYYDWIDWLGGYPSKWPRSKSCCTSARPEGSLWKT